MALLEILISLLVINFSIVFWIKRIYNYWKDRDVPYIKPSFPYGNIKNMGKTIHIVEIMQKFYNELKGKCPLGFGGVYFAVKPTVIVVDLEFVKTVMVKDFDYFMDHGVYTNEKVEPLAAHLFNSEGQRWRGLRTKLTPTFTSGKLKMMLPLIVEVAEQFKGCLSVAVEKNEEIAMKDLCARFTTDVIGTCAFGIDCNSLEDPDCIFRKMGNRIFDDPRNGRLKLMLMSSFPEISRFFGIKNFHDDVSKFFIEIVAETIGYRRKNNVVKNDFMDLLIKLLKNSESDNIENDKKLTFDEIAAQCFIFFGAGYETSSTAMSYCLYELSLNQELQEKVRCCVKDVLKKYGGEITYEAAMEMTYLDQCINETLRKYPPLGFHQRKVTKDYPVANSKIVLPKGMTLMIPAYAIHHDPEFYPDPEKFDPERFSAEEMKKRIPFSFLPFGEGPRICIGLRFAMMQTRVGLAYLVNNFKFSPCSKSLIPLSYKVGTTILIPEGGLWLKVEKCNLEIKTSIQ